MVSLLSYGRTSDCADEVTLSRKGRRAERAVATFVRREPRRVSASAAGATHAPSRKNHLKPAPASPPRLGTTLPRHWSSNLRRRMCYALYQARRANWSRSSTRCWKTRFASATPSLAPCSATTASCYFWRPASPRHPRSPSSSGSAGRSCRKPGAQPITCYRQSRCTIALTKQRSPAPACRPGSAARDPCRCADAQGDELIGTIIIYRQEVRPFTEKQIELVQNFAAQAVIAIENTRLLNELRQRTDDLSEALAQQTATSEVLQVISSSPGELEPVFKTMLENATRICEASFGTLLLYDGDVFRHVALHNAPQAWAAEQQRDPVPPRHAARVLYRVADTRQIAHIADIAAENPDEPIGTIAGARTLLIVPMLKENATDRRLWYLPPGGPPVHRQADRAGPNFAAQAVIAIENTRLLNELRQRTDDLSEALEQQTATSEVLQVISQLARRTGAGVRGHAGECDAHLRGELRQPVLVRRRGFSRAAHCTTSPPAFAEYRSGASRFPPPAGSRARHASARRSKSFISPTCRRIRRHEPTRRVRPSWRRSDPSVRADAQGRRADRRDRHLSAGGSPVHRQADRAGQQLRRARPSSPSRTRGCSTSCASRLQQQTATADVLKVISRSTFDLQTVLETLVESAARLCEADMATIYAPEGWRLLSRRDLWLFRRIHRVRSRTCRSSRSAAR